MSSCRSRLLVGTLAGALNGVLIVYLRLQPFIATLATLAAYRGLVYAISGRQLVPGLTTTPITDKWITGLETYFDLGGWLGLSKLIEHAVVSAVVLRHARRCSRVFQIVLLSTRFGRDLYTVGGNCRGGAARGHQHRADDHRGLCDLGLLRRGRRRCSWWRG